MLCLQPGAHLEAGDLSAADAQIEAISWVDQQLAYIVDTVDTLRNEVRQGGALNWVGLMWIAYCHGL